MCHARHSLMLRFPNPPAPAHPPLGKWWPTCKYTTASRTIGATWFVKCFSGCRLKFLCEWLFISSLLSPLPRGHLTRTLICHEAATVPACFQDALLSPQPTWGHWVLCPEDCAPEGPGQMGYWLSVNVLIRPHQLLPRTRLRPPAVDQGWPRPHSCGTGLVVEGAW